MRTLLSCAAAVLCAAAQAAPPPPADDVTAAALADLGLALLRQPGPANSVVSPLATAAALGMVHAGAAGAAEHEIEALFGPRQAGGPPFKLRLPALLKRVASGPGPAPFVMAGRVWMDTDVAATVPTAYTQRLARRYGADAARVSFKQSEATRGQINGWTAEHTQGRIAELLPAGSVSPATQMALTAAVHFRSAWAQPFDTALTEPRPFNGASAAPVPTLVDERSVQQAVVDGTRVYALPFAGATFTLVLAVPAEGSDVSALLKGLSGRQLARWQGALQPKRCALALPKFAIAPVSGSIKPVLEGLGVKTVFQAGADLRPMLGRNARDAHLDDVYQAAGITIDEHGGVAVAAAAATVQPKSLALPAPPCAVDRAFVFAVLHQATGTPLFMGRVGDPLLKD